MRVRPVPIVMTGWLSLLTSFASLSNLRLRFGFKGDPIVWTILYVVGAIVFPFGARRNCGDRWKIVGAALSVACLLLAFSAMPVSTGGSAHHYATTVLAHGIACTVGTGLIFLGAVGYFILRRKACGLLRLPGQA
jgi:hypothetical protein